MIIDRPIATALILFAILLLVFFLVVPQYNAFGQLQEDLGEKKAEYNAEFDYYDAIAKTYAELQSRQDDVKKIDDALPTNPSLGALDYYLQETTRENGMMMKDLYLSKTASAGSPGPVKAMSFSLDLSGDYASLGKFIIALEKSSRIFEITSISFGSPAGTQKTYSFSLQVTTHSY